ncbi:MAG: DUF3853 family protein [Alistipes sp.]|nr:DUF3853 family protein [Alistipes sp.]
MTAIAGNTPIVTLTADQLTELVRAALAPTVPMPTREERPARREVHGIKGIRTLFGVSHTTACAWKSGFLAPAVRQCGRTIVVDADFALELFAKHNQ